MESLEFIYANNGKNTFSYLRTYIWDYIGLIKIDLFVYQAVINRRKKICAYVFGGIYAEKYFSPKDQSSKYIVCFFSAQIVIHLPDQKLSF